jgi:hypothetical protein
MMSRRNWPAPAEHRPSRHPGAYLLHDDPGAAQVLGT